MDGQQVAVLRTEAATHRRALHQAIARHDLEAMRQAIHDLYVDTESPLRQMSGELKRAETYAPLVEAVVLAHTYARETPLCQEMLLNLEHTHAKFGIPHEDYEAIVAQLETCEQLGAGQDAHHVDWCAGTCLHGKVKPWRHEKLFQTTPPEADVAARSPASD